MQGSKLIAVALTLLACIVAGDNSKCEYNTCSKCISTPNCIWCSDPNITSVKLDTGETFLQCINNGSSNIDKFRDACKATIHDPPTVQTIEDAGISPEQLLNPQRINLKIRAGESTRITLDYTHQVNYPMDLYFLMDGSKSMAQVKSNLSEVTEDVVAGLLEIFTDIQLGFGMFIDKPVLPYTDMNAWKRYCDNCIESFSFKNILPLTDDHTAFQEKVSSAKGSKGTDGLEGTLDALMQVASCRAEVGWREKALKVVVVFTEAGFHMAGDGKLAGIMNPNDRRCHLDPEGSYGHSVWQDYPSISELKKALEYNNITTTFAVSKKLLPMYELLSLQLQQQSACSDMDNHKDLVELIVKPIRDIISTVKLIPKNTIPAEVDVVVSTRCKDGDEQVTDTCKEMNPDDTAKFFLDIKINDCPAQHHQTLKFALDGKSQTFHLDLEMLCQCKCDVENGEFISNSSLCTNYGDLVCGACHCYEGHTGKLCQCEEGDQSSQASDEKNCVNPNATEAGQCSGQGKCVCGQCECNKRTDPTEVIEGRYCQCTNYHKDCQANNGKICSGNGECNCNKCDCKDGWGGQVCSCSSNTDECTDNGETCSGHGKCVCNRCECEDDYEGKHCENCKFCGAKCEQHKSCVECLVFQTQVDAGTSCKDSCFNYKVTIITDMTEEYGFLCSTIVEDDCRMLYQFKDNGTEIFVWAQSQKECPTEVNPWIVVGGVLAGVVLVGLLLLLIWKIITNIKDKREYAAFLLQKESAVWNDNVSPIYKPATTQVANPLFEGTSAQLS